MNNHDRQYIFTIESIAEKFGGLTTAMFRRAHLFSKKFNVPITVLTFKFLHDYLEVKDALNDANYTNEKIKVFNMYEFLSNLDFKSSSQQIELFTIIDETNYIVEDIYTETDKNGEVRKKTYYDNDEIIIVDEFSREEKLLRRRFFNHGKLTLEYFYRDDSSIYLVKDFKGESGLEKGKLNKITLLSKDKEVIKEFQNHTDLRHYFISYMVDESKHTVIVNDSRAIDEPLIDYEDKKVSKVLVIHSTHLRKPYNALTSTIRTGNRFLFNNIDKADQIVFLTQKQKNDVIKRYGKSNNITVIPHFIEQHLEQPINQEKEHNRFVVISRYHEEKQLDHIIRSFSDVKKGGYRFKVDFFGKGKEKENLEALVKELDLDNEIFINGFTSDPQSEFSKSIGTFLTSKYEGFGLTILESLKNGCPVFAYDIKYGPSDMVNEGYNGYLIKPDNINGLTTKIINYLELDNESKNQLFKNSTDSIQEFSPEKFVQKWDQAIENSYLISSKRYIDANVKGLTFEHDHINITMKLSADTRYNYISEDVKSVTVNLGEKSFEMLNIESEENEIIYSVKIPLKHINKLFNKGSNLKVVFIVNICNENYSIRKYTINKGLKEKTYSRKLNIFEVSVNSNQISIKQEGITGYRSLLKYIRNYNKN